MKGIEIPFGAKDSELCGWEYTIPEGMEAVVEGGKVIVRRKESEDERIRKGLVHFILYKAGTLLDEETEHKFVTYLEKQKEQPMSAEEVLIRAGLKPYRDGNQWCVLAGGNIQEGICGFGDTIDEALYQFLMEVLKIQKEQKPAARENDFVSKPKNSVEILKHYLTWATTEEENCPYSWKELADAIKDGIKALEEQQPAEWSEEEKKKHCVEILDGQGEPIVCVTPQIPPSRSLWKPSKRQMEVFKQSIEWNDDIADEFDKTLQSLYNNIKDYFGL